LLVQVKREGETEFRKFNTVLSLLSYMTKAPLVPAGRPVVNALFKQRMAIENLFRAAVGLPPVNALAINQRL
jgi:myo-inositol-1-phosphate synthase